MLMGVGADVSHALLSHACRPSPVPSIAAVALARSASPICAAAASARGSATALLSTPSACHSRTLPRCVGERSM